MEGQKVWWKVGITKYIFIASCYLARTSLILLVLLFYVADLELLDVTATVYTVYGVHGCLPAYYYREIQATERFIPNRLSFTEWLHSTDTHREMPSQRYSLAQLISIKVLQCISSFFYTDARNDQADYFLIGAALLHPPILDNTTRSNAVWFLGLPLAKMKASISVFSFSFSIDLSITWLGIVLLLPTD